jgi:hypothetical protein
VCDYLADRELFKNTALLGSGRLLLINETYGSVEVEAYNFGDALDLNPPLLTNLNGGGARSYCTINSLPFFIEIYGLAF